MINDLRYYTLLATEPRESLVVVPEILNLGPKTTVKELTRMWLNINYKNEWTIFVVDPLGFVDTLTAVSKDETKRGHLKNYQSWTDETARYIYQSIQDTTGTLVIFESLPKLMPRWSEAFERRVALQEPQDAVRLGPERNASKINSPGRSNHPS